MPPESNGNAKSSLLATWAGVILTLVFGIGTAVGVAFSLAIKDTRESVTGLQARELMHEYERGKYEEKINNHGNALVKLDETLQREMRLLNATLESGLSDLDKRLQAEIAREVANSDKAGARISELLTEGRVTNDESRVQRSAHEERIKSLETAAAELRKMKSP